MFLSKLDIYSFRQFGENKSGDPSISVIFNEKFNILIGENDSGKSAIIDAIRYLLGTLSDDFEKISEDDFFIDSESLSNKIELDAEFHNLSPKEDGAFLEWLSFDSLGGS